MTLSFDSQSVPLSSLKELDVFTTSCRLLLRLFGLHIRLHDATTKDTVFVTRGWKENSFCTMIRKNGRERCHGCDREHARQALATMKPLTYRCHAGLVDGIIPIVINGKATGMLSWGQVMDRKPSKRTWDETRKACRGLGVDMQRLKKHFYQTPVLPPGKIEAMVEFLGILTRYLSDAGVRAVLLNRQSASRLFVKARTFISGHLTEPLGLSEIAAAAGASKRHIERVFRHETGGSVFTFLNLCRLDYACDRLLETNDTILTIALDSGFGSLAQFYRQFLKVYGMSPGKWRKIKRK